MGPGRAGLKLIAGLTAEIGRVEHRRDIAIFYAAGARASWADIGGALGVTPQAAHKRYRWLRYCSATDEIWHEPPLPR